MARKIRKNYGIFLALLAGIGMLLPSAFSMWNIGSFGFTFSGEKTSDRAVAIRTGAPGVYYTTLERAVNDAGSGETVYVLPNVGTKDDPIYVTESIVLKSGVTLSLPYEGTINADWSNSFKTGFEEDTQYLEDSAFADSTMSEAEKNRTSEIVFVNGADLTISSGAQLDVGGILSAASAGSGSLQGQTSGSYAQISLDFDSDIICYGQIRCRGYIKEFDESEPPLGKAAPKIEIGSSSASGASLYLPIVFYDFIGGTNALSGSGGQMNPLSWNGALFGGVFPIEIYDMPNVNVPFTVYGGNTVVCWYDMYMLSTHVPGEITLAGQSGSIFSLGSGSSATIDYEPAAYYNQPVSVPNGLGESVERTIRRGLTIHDGSALINGWNASLLPTNELGIARTTVHTRGDLQTNDISLHFSVKGLIDADISSGGGRIPLAGTYPAMAFPFSYKWEVFADNGTLTFTNRIKLLPGSTVTIESGATVQISGSIVSYDGFSSANGSFNSDYYPVKWKSGDYIPASKVINNGTIVVKSGASLGLDVTSTRDGNIRSIVFESGALTSGSTTELGWKDTSNGWTFPAHTYSARGRIATSEGQTPADAFFQDYLDSQTSQNVFSSYVDGSGGYFTPFNQVAVTVSVDDPALAASYVAGQEGSELTNDTDYPIAEGSNFIVKQPSRVFGYAKDDVGNIYRFNENGEIRITDVTKAIGLTLCATGPVSKISVTMNEERDGWHPNTLDKASYTITFKNYLGQTLPALNGAANPASSTHNQTQDGGFLNRHYYQIWTDEYKSGQYFDERLDIGSVIEFTYSGCPDRAVLDGLVSIGDNLYLITQSTATITLDVD